MRNYRTLISLLFALTCGATACADTDDGLTDSQDSLRRSHADGGSDDDVSSDADEAADEAERGEARRGDGGRTKRDGGGRGRFDRRKHCDRRGDGGSFEDFGRGRGDSDDDAESDERGAREDEQERTGRGASGFGGVRLDAGAPRQR